MIPASDIAFSQVREDPLIDLRVVARIAARLQRPVRVLMVASGGCTALSLLASPDVASIDAVDPNPAQLHLTRLRLRALLDLPPGEPLGFIGADARWSPDDRLSAYARMRDALSLEARAFWDARTAEIAEGVNRSGRFEQVFRELARALAGYAAESAPWRAAFDEVFDRGRLTRTFGEEAVSYSMDRPFSEHFAGVFAGALRRWPIGGNYFLAQALEERYLDGPDGRPPYLDRDVPSRIRALGPDRLRLHALPLREALDALPGPWDVIQNSNISDWMPVPALVALLERERGLLPPGGAVIGRRLNGDHDLAAVTREAFCVDAEEGAALRRTDRSFFYREVVLGVRA